MYQPGESVSGTIELKRCNAPNVAYDSVHMLAEGFMDTVSIIRGDLGRGPLPPEKRIMFMSKEKTLNQNGIMFPTDPMKFDFILESTAKDKLIDNYVGVDFSIVYKVTITLKKKGETKPYKGVQTFYCKVAGGGIDPQIGKRNIPHDFSITSDQLKAATPVAKQGSVPSFNFCGQIASVNCCFDEPFDGYLILKESEILIKSIEIQLVRVETFEGKTNATEIQNIQVADGNVLPDVEIPLYMLFPTIYSCSTYIHKDFKIEFHINLIVIFHNGY